MSKDMKNHVGLKIKSARTARGLTQEQLAEKISKTVESVSNLERGHTMTGVETLEHIAHELRVPLSEFFEGFDRGRRVSRARLSLELELQGLVRGLSAEDVGSAVELVEVLSKRRAK